MRAFRVSDVEAFRRYRTADEEDAISTEEMVARLRGEREPSQRMLAGTALHAILQTVDAADLPGEEFDRIESPDGFTFVFECDIPLTLLPVREVEVSRVFRIGGEDVRLVGHVDSMGGYVSDYKLTQRFDAEAYHDSYQWRCYLALSGRTKFVYEAFEFKEPLMSAPMEYRIRAHHSLPLYAYPGMEDDVRRELALLVEFATNQGIEGRAK